MCEANSEVMRRTLRALPAPVAPAELGVRLRVVASREAARRRNAVSVWDWLKECNTWTQELMRPIAIPTAGGFASALLLFGVLAPTLAMRDVASATPVSDVPTVLYTEPTVKSYIPLVCQGHDVVIDVSVDDQGRVMDYVVTGGSLSSVALRKSIENHLLTMHFNPATAFGVPRSGRVRLWFRSSRIDVQG